MSTNFAVIGGDLRIIKLAKDKLEGNLESPSFDNTNNTHGHFFKAPL